LNHAFKTSNAGKACPARSGAALSPKPWSTTYVSSAKTSPQDSKEKAFANWCIIVLHMGYRWCEWAAEKAPNYYTYFPRADNPQKSIYQVLSLATSSWLKLEANTSRKSSPIKHNITSGQHYSLSFAELSI
jgi:hypothetical protein